MYGMYRPETWAPWRRAAGGGGPCGRSSLAGRRSDCRALIGVLPGPAGRLCVGGAARAGARAALVVRTAHAGASRLVLFRVRARGGRSCAFRSARIVVCAVPRAVAGSVPVAIAENAVCRAVSSAWDQFGEFGMNQVSPLAASPVARLAGPAAS